VFKIEADRHLESLNIQNFDRRYAYEGQNSSSYRILWQSVRLLLHYGNLTVSKMAAFCHFLNI